MLAILFRISQSVVKMLVHVPGQDFRRRRGRADDKIVIDDGVGHFVGQHALVQVLHVDVNRVELVNVPGPEVARFPEYFFIRLMKGVPAAVEVYGNFFMLFLMSRISWTRS